MYPISNGFRAKIIDKEILLTVSDTGIYWSSYKICSLQFT
jgi:hypothetical protein